MKKPKKQKAPKPSKWQRVLNWLAKQRKDKRKKTRERRAPRKRAGEPPVLRLDKAFTGFGGHSKAMPIRQVRGRNQAQWRKKLRRMDHKRRARVLQRRRRGAA